MVTCCKVTGTNTPTQKTPLCFSCVGDKECVAENDVLPQKIEE